MAIRKVISRSIEDATIATADLANSAVTDAKIAAGAGGAGVFQGDNNSGALTGDTTNGKKDIFRIFVIQCSILSAVFKINQWFVFIY